MRLYGAVCSKPKRLHIQGATLNRFCSSLGTVQDDPIQVTIPDTLNWLLGERGCVLQHAWQRGYGVGREGMRGGKGGGEEGRRGREEEGGGGGEARA